MQPTSFCQRQAVFVPDRNFTITRGKQEMLGNIDPPAICQECAVITTLDSVQNICWECWTRIAEEMESRETKDDLQTEEE